VFIRVHLWLNQRNFGFGLVLNLPGAIFCEMKAVRFMMVLAAGVMPALLANAQDLAVNGSPYTPIVTRNIFGLLPIPTNPPVDPTPVAPPPKITLNGITTIFGAKEALYKVATPPKPGQPAGDMSYALGEGEGEDDIEVVKIDTDADVVTFNNHGTIQDLPMTAAPNLSTPVAPVVGPGLPIPGGGPGRFARPGGPGFLGRRNQPQNNPDNAYNPNNGDQNSAAPTAGAVPSGGDLTPEAQVILMEAQRAEWQNDPKNNPSPAIIPPTPLTDQNTPGGGTPDAPPDGPPVLPGQR